MLTLLACPRPFRDGSALAQKNAIGSWTRLHPRPEIILFGDETGTADFCREMGFRHVPDLRRNAYGTPLVSDILRKGQALASTEWVGYINSDIILLNDFAPAFQRLREWADRWVWVGGRMDLEVSAALDFDRLGWEDELRAQVKERGKPMHISSDYFVFRKGFYEEVPPFALGRGCFDNWLLWYARNKRVPLVDATSAVLAVHQSHWIPWGRQPVFPYHQERTDNTALIGAWRSSFVLGDATHELVSGGVRSRGSRPWMNRADLARRMARDLAGHWYRRWVPKR